MDESMILPESLLELKNNFHHVSKFYFASHLDFSGERRMKGDFPCLKNSKWDGNQGGIRAKGFPPFRAIGPNLDAPWFPNHLARPGVGEHNAVMPFQFEGQKPNQGSIAGGDSKLIGAMHLFGRARGLEQSLRADAQGMRGIEIHHDMAH
jgi:hypothetical protein